MEYSDLEDPNFRKLIAPHEDRLDEELELIEEWEFYAWLEDVQANS